MAATKLPTKPVLTLAVARRMVDASVSHARELGLALSIAVIDDGGHLLAFARMDGIHVGTVDVSMAKARTAVLFKKPTAAFGEGLAGGALGILAMPAIIPFEGGIPLLVEGHLVGAIGASGSSPDKDGAVSAAGVQALEKELAS